MITEQTNVNSSSNLCKLCIYRYLITGAFYCKVIPLNEECPPMFEYEELGSIIISCPVLQSDNSSALVPPLPIEVTDVPADIRQRDTILKSYNQGELKHYADQVANGQQPDDPLDVPPLRSVPISSLLGCEGKWVNLLIGNVFALTPVVFKFNRLLQQPNGYYLEGWMELPDGTWQQFGTVTPPYPASNIQVIWC
ncbi:hypothetical protein E2R58_09010 [Paenibacillus amylolyticus]|uniref:hypothetical protein n=1 Tax=Paenibacillus TaxID=44249 RepID=UPI001059EAFF|nr:hypothetical protein [Paenibacillus amylolyticus]TDL69304.1 hypothetical protein E2R58_09010 [Paenibacillus amylolyticus]